MSLFLVMSLYCCCENTLHSRESCSSPKILAHSRRRRLLLCHSLNFHFYAQENVVRLKRIQIEESDIFWMLSFFFFALMSNYFCILFRKRTLFDMHRSWGQCRMFDLQVAVIILKQFFIVMGTGKGRWSKGLIETLEIACICFC